MSYRYDKQNNSLVIEGFEAGIAPSPYDGISDARNVNLSSIPGEVSVGWNVQNTFTRLVLAGSATADAATDVATWAGGATLVAGMAVNITNNSGAGLTNNRAYFIINPTATTFQLSETVGGAAFNLTSGTFDFTVINIGKPKFFASALQRNSGTFINGNPYVYFMIDDQGRAWYYYNNTTWYYMRNLSASGTSETAAGSAAQGNGLVSWKGYLFPFRAQQISVISLIDSAGSVRGLDYLTDRTNWTSTWQSMNSVWIGGNAPNDTIHYAIAAVNDDTVYFCNTCFVGSFFENPNQIFDPTNAATFTYNAGALGIPTEDNTTCLSELGATLLIGGSRNSIYPWDRVSTGYDPVIPLAENYVSRIVSVNTNAYAFIGQRGNIYITNGSQANLYKKVPDHLSGTTLPYFTWGDAAYQRNKLYFGVKATNNAGVDIDQYGGLWEIDLQTDAMVLANIMSYGGYNGLVTAIGPLQGINTSDGNGLLMGWYTSVGGIDKSLPTPYVNSQAYIDTDLIPVGTYLTPINNQEVEFKLTKPLVSGESISIYYRLDFSQNYTLLWTESTVGVFSGTKQPSWKNAQWAQLRAVINSTATNPSFTRLKQLRLRF